MKRLLPVLMGFVVLLLSSTEGWTADFQKGLTAYKNGDFAIALREWEPLAKQGHKHAQHNLGWIYENGNGVPRNHKTAVKWYRLSAEQGHVGAQTNLGAMFAFGKGVIQDNIYAHMWWNIAASPENKDATEKKDIPARKKRDILAKKMIPSQIAKAQKLARECVKKNYKGC